MIKKKSNTIFLFLKLCYNNNTSRWLFMQVGNIKLVEEVSDCFATRIHRALLGVSKGSSTAASG